MKIFRSIFSATLVFMVAFALMYSYSSAQTPDDSGGTTGTVTEDNDSDGVLNNLPDDGDNSQPSGNDRSEELGGSGSQGSSPSDPDDNGTGPDLTNGGQDQAGGPGGVDPEDQDGNNGCGNDDDFEDDNEGNCGGLPVVTPEVTPEVTPVVTPVVTEEVPPVVTPGVPTVMTPVVIPGTTMPGGDTAPVTPDSGTAVLSLGSGAATTATAPLAASAPELAVTSLPAAGSGSLVGTGIANTALWSAAASAVLFFTGSAVRLRTQGI
jgi:hypothetical protein